MAKEVNKRVNVWLNQQGIDNNLKSIRAAITKTANELNKLPIGSEEWLRKSEKLSKLKGIYSDIQKEIGATSRELDALNKRTMDQLVTIGSLSAAGHAASAVLRRFISATQEYVDAYASLDDAMTNVSKYTGLTREEVKRLNEEFQKMDTRTPTEKLNALAADAGRLGITSKEAIKDFVEAADIINVALGEDLGEDAVKNIGKMAQMFGETETLGLRGAMIATASAVNSLAQSSSASEPYIMDFTARLAGVANTAGITQAHIMGIASAMDQNMAQVEKSATAVQKVMMDMMGKTEKYANLVGMTTEEFRNLVDSDMNSAFLTVLDKLKEIRDTGGKSDLAETLDSLKLKGAGVQDTLMKLAENTDQLREAQQLATQAYADGNSVINEYAAVNGNAAAQLEKAKKSVQDAKAALGEELIPLLTKVTQSSASGLKLAAEAVKWISEHKALVIALAVAYNRQYIAHMAEVSAKKLSVKWSAIEKAGESAGTVVTNLFALAKAKLAKNTLAAANAQKALKVAFASTPWGAIITAVTTLATAFLFFKDKTEETTKAQRDLEVQINQQYETEKKKIKDIQHIIEDENSSRDQKLKAIKKLKEIIPEYIAYLDKEGQVINNNRKAIDDYLKSLKNKIRYESLSSAITEAQSEQIKLQSDLDYAIDKAKNGSFLNAVKMEITNEIGNAREALDKNKAYIANLQGELDNMDMELIRQTGKTYAETYQTFNESILETLENGSGSGSGDTSDKKLLTRRENFQKKLQQMQEKAQSESLDGLEKTKQEIMNKYKELETEAEALYGKDSEYFREVQELKVQDLSNSLDKYIKALSDASDKMKTEVKKMLDESNPDNKETALIKAVFGEQQKWDDKFVQLEKNIANIRKILEDDTLLPESQQMSDEDKSKLLATLNSMYEQEGQLVKDNATAISNIIKQHTKSDTDFILAKEKKLSRARMNEHDRRVAEINEEYNLKIEAKRKEIETLKKLLKNNPENAARIEELEKIIEQLTALQAQETASVPKTSGSKSIWQQLAEFDWSKLKDNWQDALSLMTQGLQEFANTAFDIYNSIAQIQDNMMEAELQKAQETYDAKSAALQKQLNSGVISQKYYDAKMAKLQEEKEKKEKKLKHEQFERDKTASIIQAIINGALAISNVWSTNAGMPILAAVLTAVTAATTALQVAAIASQPNPYAKGSYIRGPQIALMGEEGDEWVASNKLLRDKKTAGIIETLDQYQKGNKNALTDLAFAVPSPKILSHTTPGQMRNFAPSNTTINNYTSNDSSELLKETRLLRKYLEDPRNRQATINRNILLEYEKLENSVKEMARL